MKKRKYSFTIGGLLLCCSSLSSAFTEVQSQPTYFAPLREKLPNEDFLFVQPEPIKIQDTDVIPAVGIISHNTLHVEQLMYQPELLTHLLISSLQSNHQQAVILLLPVYQRLSQPNEFLLQWAKAVVAVTERDFSTAIRLYRGLISENPQLFTVRLQLAIALFGDKQYVAAQEQFEKLVASSPTEQFTRLIASYQELLKRQNYWEINGGFTYLNEDNINNAPKLGTRSGFWKSTEQPENAQGINYFFLASKKWALSRGFFTAFSLENHGKYYWDNKKYNEIQIRSGLGIGYQNHQYEISLTPFVEQSWYAGGPRGSIQGTLHRHSITLGSRVNSEIQLSPHWKINSIFEYAKLNYIQRKNLNGQSQYATMLLHYLPSGKQYWFGGIDLYRKTAQQKAAQYIRYSLKLGWGQEWPKGISSRLSVYYARRNYAAPLASPDAFLPKFYKEKQKNREYGISATIWHRGIHFWGITPKITWSYQRIKSNNLFDNYDRHQVFLNFNKTF